MPTALQLNMGLVLPQRSMGYRLGPKLATLLRGNWLISTLKPRVNPLLSTAAWALRGRGLAGGSRSLGSVTLEGILIHSHVLSLCFLLPQHLD